MPVQHAQPSRPQRLEDEYVHLSAGCPSGIKVAADRPSRAKVQSRTITHSRIAVGRSRPAAEAVHSAPANVHAQAATADTRSSARWCCRGHGGNWDAAASRAPLAVHKTACESPPQSTATLERSERHAKLANHSAHAQRPATAEPTSKSSSSVTTPSHTIGAAKSICAFVHMASITGSRFVPTSAGGAGSGTVDPALDTGARIIILQSLCSRATRAGTGTATTDCTIAATRSTANHYSPIAKVSSKKLTPHSSEKGEPHFSRHR